MKSMNYDFALNQIWREVGELRQKVTDLLVQPTADTGKKFKGVEGYKFTPKEIAVNYGFTEERIVELAESRHAPHLKTDEGKIFFKLGEIRDWLMANVITVHGGRPLPMKLAVFSEEHVPTPELESIPASIVAIEGLKEFIPAFPPCVYFLVQDGKVVYVGQSIELPGRISAHRKDKKFEKVLFLCVPKSELNRVERDFIKALKPEMNGTHNPDRLVAFREKNQPKESISE